MPADEESSILKVSLLFLALFPFLTPAFVVPLCLWGQGRGPDGYVLVFTIGLAIGVVWSEILAIRFIAAFIRSGWVLARLEPDHVELFGLGAGRLSYAEIEEIDFVSRNIVLKAEHRTLHIPLTMARGSGRAFMLELRRRLDASRADAGPSCISASAGGRA